MKNNIILELNNITKSYGKPLFRPVSFKLAAGEGLFLAGHNGSGKTTCLDIIAGITKCDSGSVSCSGKIGYVMQTDGFYGSLSCKDNLLLEAGLCGLSGKRAKQGVAAVSELCDLGDFLGRKVSKCSGGMRTRVAIAAALLGDTKLLLLDEVFSHLDIEAQDEIKAILASLKQQGIALIVVSHQRDSYDNLCELMITLPNSVVSEV